MNVKAAKSFEELGNSVRARDEYWVEHAKLSFSLGLGDLFDAAGINKADFSKRIEKSPAYVTKIFKGDVNFTIETMVNLVRSLGGRLHLKVAPAGEHYEFVPAYPVETREGIRVLGGHAWSGPANLAGMTAVPVTANNDATYDALAEAA